MDKMNNKKIVISDAPFDANSSYKRGAALASVRIKEALCWEPSNLFTENRVDLGAAKKLADISGFGGFWPKRSFCLY
nr:hypothetical protein [Desulfobacula sp.]